MRTFRDLACIALAVTVCLVLLQPIKGLLPHHQGTVWISGWGPIWLFWPIWGCVDLVFRPKSVGSDRKKWVCWSFLLLALVIGGLLAFSDRPYPLEAFATVAGAFLAFLRPDMARSRHSGPGLFLSRWLPTYCFLILLSNIFPDSDLSLMLWMGVAKVLGASVNSAPNAAPTVNGGLSTAHA